MNKNFKPELLTAKSLINLFLNLHSIEPDIKRWTLKAQKKNIRATDYIKRLRSLFKAFKIEWNPQIFLDGGFLINRKGKGLCAQFQKKLPSRYQRLKVKPLHLKIIFRYLLEYRIRVQSALNLRLYEGTAALLGSKQTEGLTAAIRIGVAEIDSCLVRIIDTEDKKFTRDFLISKCRYPKGASPDEEWIGSPYEC